MEGISSWKKETERYRNVQSDDAADGGVDKGTVAFYERVEEQVVDADAVVDGCSAAEFAAVVPCFRRRYLPRLEDLVQSPSWDFVIFNFMSI